MKRKIFLFLASLCFSVNAVFAEDLVYLVVQTTNAYESYRFELSDKPVVTFVSDKELSIVEKGRQQSVSLLYAEIANMYFEQVPYEDTETEIDKVAGDEASVLFRFLDENTVEISGITEEEHVSVCAMDGKAVPAEVKRDAARVIVGLSQLPTGHYIIKLNKIAYKVFRK